MRHRHLNLWYCPVQIALPELPPSRVILRENLLIIKNTEMQYVQVGPPHWELLQLLQKPWYTMDRLNIYLSVIQTCRGGGNAILRQCKEEPLNMKC